MNSRRASGANRCNRFLAQQRAVLLVESRCADEDHLAHSCGTWPRQSRRATRPMNVQSARPVGRTAIPPPVAVRRPYPDPGAASGSRYTSSSHTNTAPSIADSRCCRSTRPAWISSPVASKIWMSAQVSVSGSSTCAWTTNPVVRRFRCYGWRSPLWSRCPRPLEFCQGRSTRHPAGLRYGQPFSEHDERVVLSIPGCPSQSPRMVGDSRTRLPGLWCPMGLAPRMRHPGRSPVPLEQDGE